MAQRLFSADFHLSMRDILRFENRPFSSIEAHDAALLQSCIDRAGKNDTIIHIGDLFSYGTDRGSRGSDKKPAEVLSYIPATFINIRGNHDLSNKVKSVCDSMQLHLSKKYPDVVLGHYPSYDDRAYRYIYDGCILLCGHVHRAWKHCLDLDHRILNINVGVDVWGYNVVTEEELIRYIDSVMKLPAEKLLRVRKVNGRVVRV